MRPPFDARGLQRLSQAQRQRGTVGVADRELALEVHRLVPQPRVPDGDAISAPRYLCRPRTRRIRGAGQGMAPGLVHGDGDGRRKHGARLTRCGYQAHDPQAQMRTVPGTVTRPYWVRLTCGKSHSCTRTLAVPAAGRLRWQLV